MKNRILCLLLCLVTLVPCLASCAGSSGDVPADDTTTAGEVIENTVSIDLTGYTIIRSDTASPELVAKISQFKKAVENSAGVTLGFSDDWINRGETEAADAKEIVIGDTKRSASEAIKAEAEGAIYAVKLEGQRIILFGSDDSKTAKAIDYFLENYFGNRSGSVITLPKELYFKSEPVADIDIIKDGKSEFSVIYDDDLDKTTSTTDDKDRRDCEVEWTIELVNKLNSAAGSTDVAPGTDWRKTGTDPNPDAYEILVGYVNYPEFEDVKAETAIDEYTISVKGRKIYIFGWNLTTLRLAVDSFEKYITQNLEKSASGNNLKIASDYRFNGKTDAWLTDIPEYPDGKLSCTYDAANGALGILIEETNEDSFKAFNASLVSAGYTLYLENELNGNLFRTYTNGKKFVHTYYVPSSKQVRIVTDKDNTVLPVLTPDKNYTKICDYSITQMILDYDLGNFGMCYIITLEDGSFIIYDGGGATGTDHVRLYNVLNTLNKRSDGIHIAAWVITHAHWDHRSVFQNFVSAYKGKFTLELMVLNAADTHEMYNSRDYDETGTTTLPNIVASLGAKLLKPYTGQYFYVRDVKFEVIYSHEALFPKNLTYYNNSTTVTRLTVAGQTITFLGDVQTEGSNVIVSMYKGAIKSDIAQVSHHGYNGATKAVYDALKPDVLLWPTSKENYKKQTAGSSSNGYYAVDFYISHSLVTVKDIFIADDKNVTLPLPYVPGSKTATYFD